MQAAVQVVTTSSKDHTFFLDEVKLREVLLQDKIKDRFVCVVSVAGKFRKGKSFLLDFFLRYMYSQYVSHDTKDWLGDEEEPLTGFSWRGGSERDTTGILMWSDVFTYDYPNGDKIAIILLDTQGVFDSQSTVKDCATVFALSTLLSSVQIYNLSQNIHEDDLQHLHLFTEYGRLALADSGKKPFQRLQFLVRDWSCPYEAKYGLYGGEKILRKRLELSDNQHPELQSLRHHITSCFTEAECFLMPHPGLIVATNPNFNGRLKDITPEFKQSLRDLVPMLMAPDNLLFKEINGQKVRARDLIQYFISYMTIFKGNKLPEPKTIFAATAETNNLTAVASAKELYVQLLSKICEDNITNAGVLYAEHLRIKDECLSHFESKAKMGGDEFSRKYRKTLEKDLEDAFLPFKLYNDKMRTIRDEAEISKKEYEEKLRNSRDDTEKSKKEYEEKLRNGQDDAEKLKKEYEEKLRNSRDVGEKSKREYEEKLRNLRDEAEEARNQYEEGTMNILEPTDVGRFFKRVLKPVKTVYDFLTSL